MDVCELVLYPPTGTAGTVSVVLKLAYIAAMGLGFVVTGMLGAWFGFAVVFLLHVRLCARRAV
jgi:hypothetical protein